MTTLIVVGLVSGLVTAVSPCVLPVLPVVLTTAVRDGPGSRRRPWVVVGGLVVSFGVFTLVGGGLLGLLGLPQDLLRWVGIAVLGAVGLGLVWPRLGHLLEAPFIRTRMPRLNRDGNGFVLGLGLGLVFVPCAGPILAAITVLAATARIGPGLVVLTAAFCVGVAIPLLAFALAGDRILGRVKIVRERTPLMRVIAGGVLLATALVIAFDLAAPLQRLTPAWLAGVSERLENDAAVRSELDALAGQDAPDDDADRALAASLTFDRCEQDPSVLADCGPAPELTGITSWINSEPLTLAELRGQVVLIDFWTYSCINCQRTLPHLNRWASEYSDDGLVVIGVHSPEFAFERVEDNVADNARRLGVEHPVALDNDFETWRAYDQRYWPAHYLVDQSGTVRQVHYGEGAYEETENLIRELLQVDGSAPTEASGPLTPDRSPETYLGSDRIGTMVNADAVAGRPADYTLTPDPPRDSFSLGGTWEIAPEYALAGRDARLTYAFTAAQVHLVLAGQGTVTVTLAGEPTFEQVVTVGGTPSLYTLYEGGPRTDVLHLAVSEGLRAYAFTFG